MEGGLGYAGVYHETGVDGWSGPTGMYYNDWRAVLTPDVAKVWVPIYVWADLTYPGDQMAFSIEPDYGWPPPKTGSYTLELLAVPFGIEGAPPVGTVWSVPTDRLLTLVLPAYPTDKGEDGYKFALSMTLTPEPAAALALVLLALCARRVAH